MRSCHGNPVPGQFRSREEEEGGDHRGNEELLDPNGHQREGRGLQHHLQRQAAPTRQQRPIVNGGGAAPQIPEQCFAVAVVRWKPGGFCWHWSWDSRSPSPCGVRRGNPMRRDERGRRRI
ncbi:hypothetical protein P4O66_000061 [Electrophorus voltai]|uniref:Uncharacterized protein n=1 Tax=Electrophorus voltai TaxID=2609070 RepID=A0AAD8ZVQ2_9TELE|nr:hypothetical protein P4O66_000061 [Electrophorus voltai]